MPSPRSPRRPARAIAPAPAIAPPPILPLRPRDEQGWVLAAAMALASGKSAAAAALDADAIIRATQARSEAWNASPEGNKGPDDDDADDDETPTTTTTRKRRRG